MKKKELLKELIVTFQESLPVPVYSRELKLPVDSRKIITVPGVRRCGKSSLFLEIYCMADDFCKEFALQQEKYMVEDTTHKHRHKPNRMNDAEIICI